MLRAGQNELRYIDWNNLHFELEWIYEGSPPLRTHVVHHPFPGLGAWLIRQGSISIEGDGVSITGHAGDWIFPPFRQDVRTLSDDLVILSLRFQATWGGDNELFQESIPRLCRARDFPRLERSAKALMRAAGEPQTARKNDFKFQPVDVHQYAKVHRVFLSWIQVYLSTMLKLGAELHRVKISDERARLAKVYLDTMPIETPMRETDLAKRIGISVAQLNRIFVKDMGVTPIAYFNDRRFNAAKELLVSSATPIKEICYELGFSDPANFTNWFRAKTKLSPKAFRREAMRVTE
ncbi:helix-turn-helix domain-containing protein [Cerasicoccus frondis]|uniref:helix-turn-helix domain-containing protein n=1 Tax=Cerasicoccus frondis TaxID=490090 RepID=UPI002852B6FB|nr:helix-turn-helix transcriptional regulator [Cerasicoccus frondis]